MNTRDLGTSNKTTRLDFFTAQDGAQLLIDLVEQCRDEIEGDHGLLRAWPGVMLSTSVEEVHDHDNKTIKYYRVSLVCQRLTPLVNRPSIPNSTTACYSNW